MVRAFLALELTADIRERLKGAQETLRSSSARMTFVEPENIHITVKFLGEVDERRLARVIEAVKTIRFTPFPVRVGEVTVNNPKRPFTVWCSVGDSGQTEALFRLVEDVLFPLGFPKETRRFSAHATLARIKDPDPFLSAVLGSLKGTTYGECMIGGITLKKSTLLPTGPVYDDLMEARW